MGGLLTVFKNDDQVHQVNFFLDFQSEPTGNDLQVYNTCHAVLERRAHILNLMESYTGCSALIQKALSNPNPENEKIAWDTLIPSIEVLKEIYEYSDALMTTAQSLLSSLCRTGSSLENQQALAKLLCDLFNFVLQFDDKKMVNPNVNNDFSYFRRSNSKIKNAGYKVNIPDDMANKMSLFYAYPTPMMTMVSSRLDFVRGSSKGEVILGLSCFANVCLNMVEKAKFTDRDMNIYCLRAMTAAIILCDHISENGVFCRRSPINIRNAVLILKNKADELGTTGLINSLKYTSKHLKDEDTPEAITALFE
jgi:hypothetical protein